MRKPKNRPRQPVHRVVQADGRVLDYLVMHDGPNREDRRRADKVLKTMGRSNAYKLQHPKTYNHATKRHARYRRHEARVRAYIERLFKAAESVVRAA